MSILAAGIIGFVTYFAVQIVRPEKPLPAPKHLTVQLQKIEPVELGK